MSLLVKLRDLGARANRIMASIQTEEACKNAFVMPFLGALGYDVFNPEEVVPEFTADVGIKKGEKVDYAIRKDGVVVMLVECKWSGKALSIENASQLFRYFTVTSARCAILTNGLVYQFYTDIDEPNKMDSHPFFVFNLLDFTELHVEELTKFSKQLFDINNVIGAAATMKHTNAIKQILAAELSEPSEAFVKLLASRVIEGRLTASVMAQFTAVVQRAFAEFIRDRLSDRLKSALRDEAPQVMDSVAAANVVMPVAADDADADIVTTDEEKDAYNIVKAICRQWVEPRRVVMRDAKSYCAVLLDDNNRKPIIRLHFNAQSRKYISLFKNKVDERVDIESIDDIFKYADRIGETIKEYG